MSDHPLGPAPWSAAQGERYRIACRLVDRWWADAMQTDRPVPDTSRSAE